MPSSTSGPSSSLAMARPGAACGGAGRGGAGEARGSRRPGARRRSTLRLLWPGQSGRGGSRATEARIRAPGGSVFSSRRLNRRRAAGRLPAGGPVGGSAGSNGEPQVAASGRSGRRGWSAAGDRVRSVDRVRTGGNGPPLAGGWRADRLRPVGDRNVLTCQCPDLSEEPNGRHVSDRADSLTVGQRLRAVVHSCG